MFKYPSLLFFLQCLLNLNHITRSVVLHFFLISCEPFSFWLIVYFNLSISGFKDYIFLAPIPSLPWNYFSSSLDSDFISLLDFALRSKWERYLEAIKIRKCTTLLEINLELNKAYEIFGSQLISI